MANVVRYDNHTDAMGTPLYIDTKGWICDEHGRRGGFRVSVEEARRLWGGPPPISDDDFADVVKALDQISRASAALSSGIDLRRAQEDGRAIIRKPFGL